MKQTVKRLACLALILLVNDCGAFRDIFGTIEDRLESLKGPARVKPHPAHLCVPAEGDQQKDLIVHLHDVQVGLLALVEQESELPFAEQLGQLSSGGKGPGCESRQ